MTHASAQAREVSYELHTLGWKAFQDLCTTISSDVLGQTFQSFGSVKDGGRDGAFYGEWKSNKGVNLSGSFTVQCKFTSYGDKSITLKSVEDELKKARILAHKGLADNYILMTNHRVSGVTEEKLCEAFQSIPEVKKCLVFGAEWITRTIKESPRLRMLVPRVYGLGDLTQILDTRAYEQAKEIIESMREDLNKIVITEAYKSSARAIIKHGFVLLIGEPASGKSIIAAALSLGALDSWGCSTISIRNTNDFASHWNPNEKQFFWVDDAFGTTQYQRSTADEWNRILSSMKAAIRKGARILFTSRDYIYNTAKSDLKTQVFPLLEDSQVVINVQELSPNEKKQILYNHIKLGNQDKSFRRQIKHFLDDVAMSRHFLPEVARRLGNSTFTKNLVLTHDSVIDFSEKPLDFLVGVVKSISSNNCAALTLLYMHGGYLVSPLELGGDEDQEALRLLGVNTAHVGEALLHMDGSLTKYIRIEGIPQWVFKHPTVGDAVAVIVAGNPELLSIYLTATSTERMMTEVTCGIVDYKGVKVIIPPNHYHDFMKRLDCVDNKLLFGFLASRCDRAFLQMYMENHPTFYEKIIPFRPYLHASSGAAVVARLYDYDLLPEEWRLKFVDTIEEHAVFIPDADFLKMPEYANMIHESERTRIISHVETELFLDIEPIERMVEDLESTWANRSFESPDDHFEPLRSALETYHEEFLFRDMPWSNIEHCLSQIANSIDRLNEYYDEPEDDYSEYMDSIMDSVDKTEGRSIFDDLDE